VKQGEIERALEVCYDAIIAPETWPQALHALAGSIGAVGCRFRGRTGQRAILDLPASPALGEFLAEFARDGWWRDDPRALGWDLCAAGACAVIDHDLADETERRKLPFYADLSRRHDLPWWVAVHFATESNAWVLSSFRTDSQGPFDREEARRLTSLRPHFARMIRFSQRFAMGQAAAQLGMLDRLACAAVLIDWRGMVLRVNRHADALLGDGLKVCRGALMATDARSNRDLQQLVDRVRAAPPSRAAPPPRRVLVRRTEKSPLIVEALPVAGLAADAFGQARAVLVMTDIERRAPVPEDLLRSVFALTPAEARLACRLAAGESLEDAAEALAVAKNTARFQLRAIFAKTGTARQGQLVALLARMAR
jgi:DNA-binding CsgD family transcriptional regulator